MITKPDKIVGIGDFDSTATDILNQAEIESEKESGVVAVEPYLPIPPNVGGEKVGVERIYYSENSVSDLESNKDSFRESFNILFGKESSFSSLTWLTENSYQGELFSYTAVGDNLDVEVRVEDLKSYQDELGFPIKEERVKLKVNKDEFKQKLGSIPFIQWIQEIVKFDEKFDEKSFSMKIPTIDNGANLLVETMTGEFKGEYNFEIPNYEKAIEDLDEKLIPNIYSLFSAIEYNNSDNPSVEIFKQHSTLNGELIQELQSSLKNNNIDLTNTSYTAYLNAWRKVLNKSNIDEFSEIANKFKDVVFPISEIKTLEQFNALIELFPLYVSLKLDTEKIAPMSGILEELQLSLGLVTSLLVKDLISISDITEYTEENKALFLQSNEDIETASSVQTFTREEWDLIDWLESYKKLSNPAAVIDVLEQSLVFVGDGELEFKNSMKEETALYRQLLLGAFQSKLISLAKSRTRNFKSLLLGELSPNESILYKIEKWSVGIDGEPFKKLQSYWMPNKNEQGELQIFDTQVKYGKSYIYKAYSYQIVFGTKYEYIASLSNNDAVYETDSDFVYQMTVVSRPQIKIVKVPYFNLGADADALTTLKKTVINDSPPLPPNVFFDPYIGVDNKVLIRMQSSIGDQLLTPNFLNLDEAEILIEKLEQKNIDAELINQSLFTPDGLPILMQFVSDDSTSNFEAYRVSEKPFSYKAFQDSLVFSGTKFEDAFDDLIEPNRKYWYVFRVKDSHSNYSNFTDVFEFKMVNNSGIIYPELELKTFQQLKNENKIKEFRRTGQKYIQIKPSILQEIENEVYQQNSAFSVDKPKLGVQENSIFDSNKKFKLRIISKKTGKKIDLNITFTHVHDSLSKESE